MSKKVNQRDNKVSMKASHHLPMEIPSQYANIERSSKFLRGKKYMDLYIKFPSFKCWKLICFEILSQFFNQHHEGQPNTSVGEQDYYLGVKLFKQEDKDNVSFDISDCDKMM